MICSPQCDFPTDRLSVDSTFISFSNDIPFEKPVFEELLFDISDNDKEVVHHSSQRLLLSSQRLSSVVGADTARSIVDQCLNNLRSSNSSLFDDIQGIDKLDLSEIVRSRFIQTPSEFQAYINHLDETLKRSKEEKSVKQYFADCFKSYVSRSSNSVKSD